MFPAVCQECDPGPQIRGSVQVGRESDSLVKKKKKIQPCQSWGYSGFCRAPSAEPSVSLLTPMMTYSKKLAFYLKCKKSWSSIYILHVLVVSLHFNRSEENCQSLIHLNLRGGRRGTVCRKCTGGITTNNGHLMDWHHSKQVHPSHRL